MSGALAADTAPVKRSVRLLRVSSKKQTDTDYDRDPEGNSIDTQRKVTMAKERAMGLVNVDEYVEPGYSAQTIERRPFFQKMMKRIIEQRDVDYVVIYMRSRIFRNYVEAAIVTQQLAKLGVKLISAKEDFGDGLMAEAMEAVTDVFNWLQNRMSGEDIKVKMANKARNGGTIGRAKVGYLNQRILIDGHKVNTVAPDPERAHFIPMAFELFATGQETVASLRGKLTSAGFLMPATTRDPSRPISLERLRLLLRDRYYLGYVTFEGIEYQGRHEPLISQELFDRVQRILDSHSGSGTRHRTHNHYLKGLVYCGRCKYRLIVMPGNGNGGTYYYFVCRGRQEGLCDLPYIPVEVLEEAVVRYYGEAVSLPAEWLAQVSAGLDAAVNGYHGLSDALRKQYVKRLDALDRKENYYLDLAAEQGWPKDKLRARIDAIRSERGQIEDILANAEHHLDRGREVFRHALALLEAPQAAYERGDEAVRSILNKALFTRLYVDAGRVIAHDLEEPFDILVDSYATYQVQQGRSGQSGGVTRVARETSDAADQEVTDGAFALALEGQGSSKTSKVGDTGIAPLTSSV
jgi:site-specific DNA recombinase